jgi:hypothetical protein
MSVDTTATRRTTPMSGKKDQPNPVKNNMPAAWDLVLADIVKRDKFGEAKYGTRLQPLNGRDGLQDAYEEALDLVVYLRLCIYERDNINRKREDVLALAVKALNADWHSLSTRPCSTCQSISTALGEPFGCNALVLGKQS